MKPSFYVKAAVVAVSALILSTGCGSDKSAPKSESGPAAAGQESQKERAYRAEDFADKTFAILSGSTFDGVARNTIGVRLCKYYNTPAEAVEAVVKGEADATLLEEPVARKFAANNAALAVLYPMVDIENYASIFNKKDGGKLRDNFNAFLKKIRADGTYEDMVKRWIDSQETPPMPKIELKLDPAKGGRELTFATSDCDEPFAYKAENEELIGFDVELAQRFAREYGHGLTISVMDFPDIIPAVSAGRVDFASNLFTFKEERLELVDFSDPVYYGGTVVLTKK